MRSYSIISRSGALVLAGLSVSVSAQDAKDHGHAKNSYLEALRHCSDLTESTDRLACYDNAAKAILTASDSGELKIVGRREVRETRRKLFGFSIPDLGILGDSGKDKVDQEKIDQLETTISKVRAGAGGNWILTTAEGAVWEVYDIPLRLMKPRVGDKLEIRKGALTSYFLRIDGQAGVKGRRIS